jgi:UDP-glucose 4-epimerase
MHTNDKTILVTGGAGYIGSVTTAELIKKGYKVIVFDSLENGHSDAVTTRFIKGDLLNMEDLNKLNGENIDTVIHFAAYAEAGESMQYPYKYFQNNIQGGLNLLEYMKNSNIKKIIFSSTCAIYGTPKNLPVSEENEKNPESVYGESKYMFEKILKWYDQLFGIKYINLRYFNAAGASMDGKLGENHKLETHIIPLAIKSALTGSEFTLYGNDYPTKDGTCIRDYIHVLDLAEGHILAMDSLSEGRDSNSYNLGTGKGYSNLEVINKIKEISDKDFPVKIISRRAGDPPLIYADNSKAVKELGFSPQYSDLETIISTAWKWHSQNS